MKKQAEYSADGKGISLEDAMEEVVADGCELMLRDSKRLALFNAQHEEGGRRVIRWLREFLQRIKNASIGLDAAHTEAKALESVYGKIQRIWTEGLIETAELPEGNGKIDSGREKFAIKAEAVAEIDKALADKNYGGDIQLTDTTPTIMLAQKGVKNLPLVMNASHIRKNILTEAEAKALGLSVTSDIHYHGLGKKLFINVINDLQDVSLAYRGTAKAFDPERGANYFLLISQYKDQAGNTINVPVFINQTKNINRVFINANALATVFGRNNFNQYIQRELNKNNLVRIKNRAPKGSESPALIAVDYANVSSLGEAADQTAMASRADNVPQVTGKSNTQNGKSSIKSDEDYLAAVNSGDMETAQRMVDEAAKGKASIKTLDDGTQYVNFS